MAGAAAIRAPPAPARRRERRDGARLTALRELSSIMLVGTSVSRVRILREAARAPRFIYHIPRSPVGGERGLAVDPGSGGFQLGGEAQNRRLVAEAADELRRQRQAVWRLSQR